MCTSFPRLLPFTLLRTLIKLPRCDFLSRCCKTQFAFSTTRYSKLTCDDSRLLQCLSQCRLQEARRLLEKLPERDGHGRVVHWTSLLTKYCKNGWISEARMLFEIMPGRNIVTYNAMLSGYVQSGRLSEAWHSKRPSLVETVKFLLDEQNLGVRKALSEVFFYLLLVLGHCYLLLFFPFFRAVLVKWLCFSSLPI